MKRAEAVRFLILRSIGNFLVLVSLYGVYTIFGPVISYELQYRIVQLRGMHFVVAPQTQVSPDQPTITFSDILEGDKTKILIPKDTLFSIIIPKIGATAKVFPNVDPANSDKFAPVLMEGVAHAKGSVFPGHAGNIYLFAHSAASWFDAGRYNAIFYLLNHVNTGDDIAIYFENTRFTYVVTKKEILDAHDTRYLTQKHGGKEQLILQTCWPPGTTWKRMYVVGERRKTNN